MSEEKDIKLKLRVKGNIRDLLAFKNLIAIRKKKIHNTSSTPKEIDSMKDLSQQLHPIHQFLIIKEIIEETKSSKTYKLVPDLELGTSILAYFRAGQYLSLIVNVDGVIITRPYSISSSPIDALNGFYNITIKKEEHGFLTNFIWENWKIGTKIHCSGPEGLFYHEPLRDSTHLVGIAGGSGITPFRSLAKAMLFGLHPSINSLTILYGSNEEDDIIFYDYFKELETKYPEKIKIINVLSCEEVSLPGCETGFITSEIISKYVDVKNCSFFISGPQVMYNFVEKEIEKFDIPLKNIRKEVFGEIKDILNHPGFPKELAEKTFKILVHMGNVTEEIPAIATESILVALERAKLAPPSKCRSGICGFCRSVLISGKIFISNQNDGRRTADKLYNYFHPCSSFPISNLEILVPRAP